jgi:HTH-type transcriptional regulator/antitoxin HipB
MNKGEQRALSEASKKLVAVSHEELEDRFIGKRGTPRREAYEVQVAAALIGASIKKLRTQRGLTQTELGKLVGVQRSQISKLEKTGTSMTLETAMKLFHALGATLTLNIEPLQ